MKAYLKPDSYINESFQQFDTKVFFKNWIFIGKESELLEENSFITKTIGDIPVVVQKLKGKVRAFKNVCSHRHSKIQLETKGIRPLICPYHGWTYNAEGDLVGIPKKPLFQFSREEQKCLSLKEYKLESCGGLLFIHLGEQPDSLKQYLGSFYNWIETFGENASNLVDLNSFEIKANWKVLVENTLESYHVALVHTETFQKLGTSGLDFNFSGKHSLWKTALKKGENDGVNKVIYNQFQSRNLKIDGYEHLLVYPNLLLSSTYGVSFNLSVIDPINSDSSVFTSYVYLTDSDGSDNSILNAYKDSLIEFNRRVFNEDKVICEAVQLGMKSSHYLGELSDEELRVAEFQKQILVDIDGK